MNTTPARKRLAANRFISKFSDDSGLFTVENNKTGERFSFVTLDECDDFYAAYSAETAAITHAKEREAALTADDIAAKAAYAAAGIAAAALAAAVAPTPDRKRIGSHPHTPRFAESNGLFTVENNETGARFCFASLDECDDFCAVYLEDAREARQAAEREESLSAAARAEREAYHAAKAAAAALAAGLDTPEVKPSLRDRAGGPVFTVERGYAALLTKNSWGRVAHAVYIPETPELVEALITIDRHTRSASAARELVTAHLKATGAVSRKVLSVDAVLESFRKMCARSPGLVKAAIKAGVTMNALVQAWQEENCGITTPWDAELTTAQLDWVKSTYTR